jgi:hypothetical protein
MLWMGNTEFSPQPLSLASDNQVRLVAVYGQPCIRFCPLVTNGNPRPLQ